MVRVLTDHRTQGKTSVASGDTWSFTVTDDYRRLVEVDLVGDVERDIYVKSKDGVKFQLFGNNITGEGDIDVEAELFHDDEVHIDYKGSATVSDVVLLRRDRPIGHRIEAALETNQS